MKFSALKNEQQTFMAAIYLKKKSLKKLSFNDISERKKKASGFPLARFSASIKIPLKFENFPI